MAFPPSYAPKTKTDDGMPPQAVSGKVPANRPPPPPEQQAPVVRGTVTNPVPAGAGTYGDDPASGYQGSDGKFHVPDAQGFWYATSPEDLEKLRAMGVPDDKIRYPTGRGDQKVFTNVPDIQKGPANPLERGVEEIHEFQKDPVGYVKGILPSLGLGGGPPPQVSADLTADMAAARERNAGMQSQLDNYQPAEAPQQIAARIGNVAPATAATSGPAAQAAGVQVGPAARATAPTLGPAAQATATLAGPAAGFGGVTVDRAAADQVRARQLSLADAVTAAMEGKAPSVAEQQLKMGAERLIKQQYALAASARGQNVGLAAREAAMGAADIGAELNAQAALLRAQETATARGQLGAVLGDIRGVDAGLATTDAQLAQQAGIFSAGERNATERSNAALGTNVNVANAGFTNEQSRAAAQIAAQIEMANAAEANKLTGLGAELQSRTNIANAGFTNERDALLAKLENEVRLGNMTAESARAIAQGQFDQQASAANLDALLRSRELDLKGQQDLRTAILTGQGQTLSAGTSLFDSQAKIAAAEKAGTMGLISAGLGAIAASDERLKTDIEDGEEDTSAFLASLNARKYRYRDTRVPGTRPGQRFGIMAQDLERSPMGKSLVLDTPVGKMVDVPMAVGAILASMGNLHRRVGAVEARA